MLQAVSKHCVVPVVLWALCSGICFGWPAEDKETSPYVILYARRVEIVKVEIEKQHFQVALADANFRRIQRLVGSGAATNEDYDERSALLGIARARLKDLELRVREEEALYEIARLRISNGMDMPICRVNI